MKLLFVADVPVQQPASGAEQMLHQQALGLKKRGMNVSVITRTARGGGAQVENFGGVTVGQYEGDAKKFVKFGFSVIRDPVKLYSRFAKENHFDWIIAHQPFSFASLLLRKRINGTPVLYNFHSPSHEEFLLCNKSSGAVRKFVGGRIRRSVEKYCVMGSSKVMVESGYMQEKIYEIHGIPFNRTVVNPGGVDVRRFLPSNDRAKLKREIGLAPDQCHLLTVRNLEPRMGLESLIYCVDMLRKKNIGVHVTIGGKGSEQMKLANLINSLNLNKMVSMVGFIRPEMLPKYYAGADYFILPTKELEGFGLVTVEALACGTPVLGTPVGGTREILSKFDSRFLFRDTSADAMAEKIEMVIKRSSESGDYEQLRKKCREFSVRNYSWNRHLDQLESILTR